MEITTIAPFLDYYEKLRGRTLNIIKKVPPEYIEWTYKQGKFTIGDLIRHLATIERYMYGETVSGRPSAYPGCGKELAEGYENTVAYMNRLHAESMQLFAKLTDEDLQKKCLTPAGTPITTWKWLRAMCEHEIHHRGQIFIYLGMLDIKNPALYGLTAEEVQERSKPLK
ncbi:MAG: DinB family protein [Bacteroidia bacterium]